MKCPHCGHEDSKVVNSRPGEKSIRRRRECLNCGKRFTTYETVVEVFPHIIKKDSRREDYDRSKLEKGIRKALEKRPVSEDCIRELVDKVESRLYKFEKNEISSAEVGDMVMDGLRNIDIVAYVRFASVYREFKDISDFMTELQDFLKKQQ